LINKNKQAKIGSYYLFGSIFNKGIAFLVIPIFTRILTTYDYGIINTYNAWVGILTMIVGMTLHMSIRSSFNDYKENIDDFMSSSAFLTIINSITVSIMTLIIVAAFKINIDLYLVLLCLIQSFSVAIIEDYNMYLMMKYEYKKRTFLLVVPNLLINIFAMIFIVLVLSNNLYLGKIIPGVVINFIFSLVILTSIFKKSKKIYDLEYWKYAVAISAPVIVHGISLNILSQSDRIMLTSLSSASDTGVYSLIYNFSMITSVIAFAIDGVFIPDFNKSLGERKIEYLNERVKLFIEIMTFSTIVMILISPEVLKIIAPQEYWRGIDIIPPIVLSSFIIYAYTLYVNIEHFHKKTKRIAINTIFAAGLNIILNYLFIPKYGIVAAAYSTLISYTVSFFIHYYYARKIEKKLFPLKSFFKPIFFIVISIVVFYMFKSEIMPRFSIVAVILLFEYYKNKKYFHKS